ncbi:MAG TPA: DUF6338 family protein, partial [Nocardioidaceae bacterium]|nr:DUF6338 family protein [Nocardioidaceae bacterium]
LCAATTLILPCDESLHQTRGYSVLGGLYSTRGTRAGWQLVRNHLSTKAEQRLLQIALGKTPAPRVWDDLFSDRPFAYLRIKTVTGEWLAGLFADRSYAGGFPHEADLLLEETWRVSDNGEVLEAPLGYPVYIPANQIAWVEVVPQAAAPEEGSDVRAQDD